MDETLRRRSFLEALGAASASLVVGCGAFPAESGAAYAPWEFPAGGESPERAAVHAALLAASPHNTQPWAFAAGPDRIEVFAVPSRNLGVMDGLRREMHIGLGCAVENLVVAARAEGRAASVALFPEPADATLVARVGLAKAPRARGALFEAIASRRTNRGEYLDGGAPAGLEAALRAQIDDPAVELTFLDDAEDRASFRAGTVAATEAIVADAEMNAASHAWYRHTREEIERHRDGTTLDATGNGATTRYFGKMVGRPDAATAGAYWLDMTRGPQATAAAYVLLSTADRDDRAAQVRVGRAFQRVHLWATAEGLALQPQNQMAELQDREQVLAIAPRFSATLAALTGRARSGVQMAFRIGEPWDEALSSPRRPLAWVLR
jgi:hypothetical protein